MAQCPVCQANVNADFGLVECESCGAQLIIHVDGTVEHSGSNEDMIDIADNGELSADEVGAAPQPGAGEEQAPRDDDYNEDFVVENLEAGSNEAPMHDDEAAAVPDFDGSEVDDNMNPPGEVYKPPTTTNSPDLSDIAQFGNSDASSGREGALRYSVQITGIDTANVREELREALTDRKFMWDADQILRTIRNGEVRITNVSATKAYMLISRLRSMPVQVRWEQYAVHQA